MGSECNPRKSDGTIILAANHFDYMQQTLSCETNYPPKEAQPYRVLFTFDTQAKKEVRGEG